MKRGLSSMQSVPALVSASWLSAQLSTVKVIDAPWYLPSMKRDAWKEFNTARIPGATFFDIDKTDDKSDLPHMLPSSIHFASTMLSLGVSSEDHIVCYDCKGLFSAARLWWMLKAFGHTRSSVLDGGLPAWQRANLPVETGAWEAAPKASGAFNAKLDQTLVADLTKMRGLVDSSKLVGGGGGGGSSSSRSAPIVLDARSKARFEGTVAEARPNCRSGHMPGSRSLPFDTLLDGDGLFKPDAEVKAAFAAAGVADINAPLIGSCGSGVTASVLALALEHIGREGLLEIYDGSWAEYGSDVTQPLATGSADDEKLV